MNRRDLFKFAAVGAAGLLIPEPIKTYFLPPRYGWNPSALGAGYMREVQQYLINIDEHAYRYDAIGRDIWGYEHQFHVNMDKPFPAVASQLITNRFQHDGLIAVRPSEARQFRLELPRAVPGRYV